MRPSPTSRRFVQTLAAVAALALLAPPSAAAPSPRIDPATLARGADPAIPYLVGDTIRDGVLHVRATGHGVHEALWVVRGGYLVRDYNVGPRRLTRVVYVSSTGERRVVARSRDWIGVAVATSGRVLAVQTSVGTSGQRTRVTVERSRSGRVVARKTFRLSSLVAVTERRVLLGRRAYWHDPATAWWSYQHDRLHRIYGRAALRADVAHDRVVFITSSVNAACVRVAVLSRPTRTLWRSCRRGPHGWSPDGRHALVTHTYFDAAGTDSWWVADGRTGHRRASIRGRLDWTAVWEDDGHFLTLAQSDTGRAAIIRCDLAGACERASRLWRVPVPEDSVYYAPPPVVLAQ